MFCRFRTLILLSTILLPVMMLSPTLIVSLRLDIPVLMNDNSGWRILFSWTKELDDPGNIGLKIRCPDDLLSGAKLTSVSTSKPNVTISIGGAWIIADLARVTHIKRPCHLFAADTLRAPMIASSDGFRIVNTSSKGDPRILKIPGTPIVRNKINANTTSSISSGTPSPSLRRGSKNLYPLIGGLFGSVVFLFLALVFCCLRQRVSQNSTLTQRKQRRGLYWFFSAPFRRDRPQNLIAEPMPYEDNYTPPENKRERLERARQGLNEARRLHGAFQLDLAQFGHQTNTNTPRDSVVCGLERAETQELQTQFRQISMMIAALHAEIQQQAGGNSRPPDYSPTP